RYRDVACQTLDFMLRELATEDGGFASALDADSEGQEGRFYTWELDPFLATLGEAGLDAGQAQDMAAYWGVAVGGNWEGRSILHVAGPEAPSQDVLARSREPLLNSRVARIRPGRDDKQLAAWNGMALRALSHGYLVLGEDRFAES